MVSSMHDNDLVIETYCHSNSSKRPPAKVGVETIINMIIFKQIYLIHIIELHRYYHSRSEWVWEQCQRRGDFTLPRVPELEFSPTDAL